MKDTPEYRDKLLDAIFRGEEAKRIWKDVKPFFERAHDVLLDDLVSSVSAKADKEDILLATYRLTGLREIANAMRSADVTGKRAQEQSDMLEAENAKS